MPQSILMVGTVAPRMDTQRSPSTPSNATRAPLSPPPSAWSSSSYGLGKQQVELSHRSTDLSGHEAPPTTRIMTPPGHRELEGRLSP